MWKLTITFPADKKPKVSQIAELLDDAVGFNITEIPDAASVQLRGAEVAQALVDASPALIPQLPMPEVTEHDEFVEKRNNHVPNQVKASIDEQAREAYEEGGQPDDNPYTFGTQEYQVWQQAFMDLWGSGE